MKKSKSSETEAGGIIPPGDIYAQLVDEFTRTHQAQEALQWALADIALKWVQNKVRDYWRRKDWRGMSEEVGLAPGTLMRWAATVEAFPEAIRLYPHEYLTFEHHAICAATNDALYWLQLAADKLWSTAELKAAILEATGEKVEECPAYERVVFCTVRQSVIQRSVCDNCLMRPDSGKPCEPTSVTVVGQLGRGD